MPLFNIGGIQIVCTVKTGGVGYEFSYKVVREYMGEGGGGVMKKVCTKKNQFEIEFEFKKTAF